MNAQEAWGEYIGQAELKRQLLTHIAAALAESRPLEHTLLVGPPGVGKTTVARLVARTLGRTVLPCARELDPEELDACLGALQRRGGGVLFIDEVHLWRRKAQDRLLTFLEETAKSEWPDVTVIAATTDRQMLAPAFISRFTLQPSWAAYTEDDMRRIVAVLADREDAFVPPAAARDLARASFGRPRQARRLVRAWRAQEATGGPSVSGVLALAGIEPDGLTAPHIELLEALEDLGGRAGVATLALRLRLPPEDIQSLERDLVDLGLLDIAVGGRRITERGSRRAAAGIATRDARRASAEEDVDRLLGGITRLHAAGIT